MTNQPFLHGGGLLFCKSGSTRTIDFGGSRTFPTWKIWHRSIGDEELAIPTPTTGVHGNILSECNPHLYPDGGGVRLGYVAGFYAGPGHPVVYHHVHCTVGADIDEVGELVVGQRVFSAAFVGGELLFTKKTPLGDELWRDDAAFALPFTVDSIYRVVPVMGEPDHFLLTGSNSTGDHSWLVRKSTGKAVEVKNLAGGPVYKCSLLGNKLAYTVKGDGGSRELVTETLPAPLI